MSDVVVASEIPVVPALKAIIGQKVGMTQIFDAHGTLIPVTVLQAGPCQVLRIFTKAKNGYEALQVGFGEVREKSLSKPFQGQFKKANAPSSRWIREIRTSQASSFQIGQALKVNSFVSGDFVDVTGVSKGKGFAGAVKRHNFGGGPSTHGQSDRQRAPGASGSNTYPGRVYKGKLFPGHLGAERVTTQHLEVVEVVPEQALLLLRGAVPGPKQGLVVIKQTTKRVKFHAPKVVQAGKKEKAAKKESASAKASAGKPATGPATAGKGGK